MGVLGGSDLWALGVSTAGFLAGLVNSVFTRTGHVTATGGDYTAAEITNVPAAPIAAVTVQAALNELGAEKAALAGAAFTGAVTVANTLSALDAAGGALLNEAATATNASIVPNRADPDTGFGWAAADQLSLIAGAVEGIRITEAAAAITVDVTGMLVVTSADIQGRFYGGSLIGGTNANAGMVLIGGTGGNGGYIDYNPSGTSVLRISNKYEGSGLSAIQLGFGNSTTPLTILQNGIIAVRGGLANGQLLNIKSVMFLLSPFAGASMTATNLIPAGAVVVGVTVRVTTLITGPAGFDVGDGVDVDRWGNSINVALNTTTDATDYTATDLQVYPAATDVVITSDGAVFTAGALRITVHYFDFTPATG